MSEPPLLRVDNKSTYPARIGLILGVIGCVGYPAKQLPRARKILEDKFGGLLYLRRFTPQFRKHWQQATNQAGKTIEEPAYLFSYECDGDWGDHLNWHVHPMGHARLAIYAVQLAGPFDGFPHYICYAALHKRPEVFYWTEKPSRFTPAMFSAWGYFRNLRNKAHIDEIVQTCRDVFSALGVDHHEKYMRVTSPKKHVVRGTRLETAIVYYSQSMTATYMQDTGIRAHIALENLFRGRGIDKSLVLLLASVILSRSIDPSRVRSMLRLFYKWRNEYVHGDFPPHQFGGGSEHTKALRKATRAGTVIVSSLIKEILRSPRLLSIFNAHLEDEEFVERLYKYAVQPRASKHR